jgi:hypothetical protein
MLPLRPVRRPSRWRRKSSPVPRRRIPGPFAGTTGLGGDACLGRQKRGAGGRAPQVATQRPLRRPGTPDVIGMPPWQPIAQADVRAISKNFAGNFLLRMFLGQASATRTATACRSRKWCTAVDSAETGQVRERLPQSLAAASSRICATLAPRTNLIRSMEHIS